MGKSIKKTKTIRHRQKSSADQIPRSLRSKISGPNFTLIISGSAKDWKNFYDHYFFASRETITNSSQRFWMDMRGITYQILDDDANKKQRSYSKKVFRNTLSVYAALMYEWIKVFRREKKNNSQGQMTYEYIKQLFEEELNYYREKGSTFPNEFEGLQRHYISPGRKIIKETPNVVTEAVRNILIGFYGSNQRSHAYRIAKRISLSLCDYRSKYDPKIVIPSALGIENELDETREALLGAFPSLKQII